MEEERAPRLGVVLELAEERPAFRGDAIEEAAMSAGIGIREARREHGDRRALGVERALVRGGVDAVGATGDDRAACAGERRGEIAREGQAVLVRPASPDDRDRAIEQGELAADP